MDISTIQGAIGSLKAAGEIVKVLYGAKLSADIQQKVSDLQQLIFDARQSAFDAQEELAAVKAKAAEFESQIVEFEQWGEESKRYKLTQPESLRSVVYALKEADSNSEPPHYLCTSCYQQRRKSILNLHKPPDGWTTLLCPVCRSEVSTGMRGPIVPVFAPV